MLLPCRQALASSAAGEDCLLYWSYVSLKQTHWEIVRCCTHVALSQGDKVAHSTTLLGCRRCAAQLGCLRSTRDGGCVAVDPHASISCVRAVVAMQRVPELRACVQLFPGGMTDSAAQLQVAATQLLATERILPRNTRSGSARCGSSALTLSH